MSLSEVVSLTQTTSLMSALSTGLAKCAEPTVPEALVQLVETMNTELGHLGVFNIEPTLYFSTGIVYSVMLKQEGEPFKRAFTQLNYHKDDWYSFCDIKVDNNYQSLYDALVEWLKNPQNILQLNLNKQSSGETL